MRRTQIPNLLCILQEKIISVFSVALFCILSSIFRCQNCQNRSKRLSRFYELDLNLQGHSSLNQCIKEFLKVCCRFCSHFCLKSFQALAQCQGWGKQLSQPVRSKLLHSLCSNFSQSNEIREESTSLGVLQLFEVNYRPVSQSCTIVKVTNSGRPLHNQIWQTEWKTAPVAKVQLCEYENQTLEAFVEGSHLYAKFDCPATCQKCSLLAGLFQVEGLR